MRRAIVLLAALLALPLVVSAREKRFGYCQAQTTGARVKTCTVTIYQTGTLTLATIYQDNVGTPKSNPFTASSSTGLWFFYSDNGRYDVKFSGGAPTISPPYTLSDYLFLDLGDPTGDVTVQSLRSASANIAQSGFIRMASPDFIAWRDSTNATDILLSKSGALSGNYPADTIQTTTGFGAPYFTALSTTAATAGLLRLQTGDTLCWRNNANGANACLSKNASDNLVWPNNLGVASLTASATVTATTSVTTATFISSATNPSTTGTIRLAKSDSVKARNATNGLDLTVISIDGSDNVLLGDGNVGHIFVMGTSTSTALTLSPTAVAGKADAAFNLIAQSVVSNAGRDINLIGSSALASAFDGGAANVTAGNGGATGTGGSITLTPGTGGVANGSIKLQVGVSTNGSGYKHANVTTGSISGTTRAEVTITWGTAFADTSYDPTCSVQDGTSGATAAGLVMERIRQKTASIVTAVVNNPTGGALTGTLYCTGTHN